MDKINIFSDGTAKGTKVTQNGVEIKGISAIKIEDITPNSLVRAKLTFEIVELDLIVAELETEGGGVSGKR